MVICVLGLPGAGKTTLVRRLKGRLSAPSLHPGRHAVEKGLVQSAHPSREELLAVPGLAESFISRVLEVDDDGDVLIDGFPRSVEQARLLVQACDDLIVIHLVFPEGDEGDASVSRQKKRLAADSVTFPDEHLERQCELAIENDLPAIEELKRLGANVIVIDATLSEEDVERLALKHLA